MEISLSCIVFLLVSIPFVAFHREMNFICLYNRLAEMKMKISNSATRSMYTYIFQYLDVSKRGGIFYEREVGKLESIGGKRDCMSLRHRSIVDPFNRNSVDCQL